ncbi:MAG: glycosyltransferase, partial [Candidatus Berkelbacteria bacterium]|nr:glycosyltransferase [Candidatus Berkelbacteria bacterium]
EILAGNMTKAGHEVYVFCPGDGSDTHLDKNFTDYKVLRLKSFVNPFRKGFRITSFAISEIREQVRKIKPDIIHLQDVASIGIMLRDIGRESNIPVIITNHFSLEFALAYVKLPILLPLARKLLIRYLVAFHNKCDIVITPTETIAKQIRSWKVKTPVIAISNGIFYDRFSQNFPQEKIDAFRLKNHLPDNPIVLYTGRIDLDKSVDVIIKSMSAVIKATNAHFVFAGSGDMISEIEAIAENEGVRKDATFLGRIDHESDEFIALYKCARVFAIASTIETQSLVTLEAMSAGLPVVAAKANALPEIVKSDFNGFLFTPGDEKALAEHLIKILTDNSLWQKFSRHSMQLASHHEMSLCFARTLTLYNMIIAQKKTGRIEIPEDFIHPENAKSSLPA